MSQMTRHIFHKDLLVSLPLPVLPVIEDVGWWRGEDGSTEGQPYRNAFPRCHCLADYQALACFARKLGVRLVLGMVLGEWDRTNFLGRIPGATWMGGNWDNSINQGAWLEEAACYLREQHDCLELGLHGVCHEFWHKGRLERAEFHDKLGNMRPRQVIESHLEAFAILLEQNGFADFPRLFIPPALNHSFGNSQESIQALLHNYGISYVISLFSRARCFSEPRHPKMSWEAEVRLLDRGLAPVAWNQSATQPRWDFSGPVLPLHWGNLLHPDPNRNCEVVEKWATMLLEGTKGPHRILAENLETCWSQAAVFFFGKLLVDNEAIILDLQAQPRDMPGGNGHFFIKVMGPRSISFQCRGGRIIRRGFENNGLHVLKLKAEKERGAIQLVGC